MVFWKRKSVGKLAEVFTKQVQQECWDHRAMMRWTLFSLVIEAIFDPFYGLACASIVTVLSVYVNPFGFVSET